MEANWYHHMHNTLFYYRAPQCKASNGVVLTFLYIFYVLICRSVCLKQNCMMQCTWCNTITTEMQPYRYSGILIVNSIIVSICWCLWVDSKTIRTLTNWGFNNSLQYLYLSYTEIAFRTLLSVLSRVNNRRESILLPYTASKMSTVK